MASPIDFRLTNPALVVGPAIAGTTGILRSALRCSGPQLSAVVITSSVAAIVSPPTDGYTFTEDDWNNYAEKQVEEAAGKDCPANVCYAASKTAAEKAIWAFREKEKVSFSFISP
jgi:nucleoside-diphosphate-sugar epimerase